MCAAWRDLAEAIEVEGEAVVECNIQAEANVEPGGRSGSAVDGEGTFWSRAEARGESPVGITEIPGIAEADAGDKGGAASLERLLKGESELERHGVVGGGVVLEGVAGLAWIRGFDQGVTGLHVGAVVGGGGLGVAGLVELEPAEAEAWGEAALVASADQGAETEAAADGGAAGGAFLCGGVTGDVDLTGDVSGEATGGEGT